MLQEFQLYIETEKIVPYRGKMLLAISGGKDSVCMAHLFKQANLDFAIAHCNFQLRGTDSNDDADFVKKLAFELEAEYHSKSFDTLQFASEHKISTQMAARQLRYDYFHELLDSHGYAGIATAHHMDDIVETMILNLARGTGLAGLHGIFPIRKNVYRPLLFTNANEIEQYLRDNNYGWREDASNKETKYKRNLVRHKILPVLEELNPSFRKAFSDSANRIRSIENYLKESLAEERAKISKTTEDEVYVQLKELRSFASPEVLLDFILSDYGFLYSQSLDIIKGDHSSGKLFRSNSHELLIDRNNLIIRPHDQKLSFDNQIQITKEGEFHLFNLRFDVKKEKADLNKIDKSPQVALLDADKIRFPLIVRAWNKGDSFRPLGMKGEKKVSDFLIDNKVSLFDKERTCVILSGDKIVWLAGHRISEDHKLTTNSNQALKIEIKPL